MTIETKAVPHTATIDVFVGDQIETFDLADLDFSNHTEMTLVTLGLYDPADDVSTPVYRLGVFDVTEDIEFLDEVIAFYQEESNSRDLEHRLGIFPVNGTEEAVA